MIRPGLDLEAIDRELARLGEPRPDIRELVARYVAPSDAVEAPVHSRAEAAHSSAPPQDRSEPPEAAASSLAASEPMTAAAVANGQQDLSEDHDEFELLVDDEEIALVEDDQFEVA